MDWLGAIQVSLLHHFFMVAVPVCRPDESRKVMMLLLTVLVPVIRPDESR